MASRVANSVCQTHNLARHSTEQSSPVVGDCGKGPHGKFTFSPRNPARNRPNSFASGAERLGAHFTHHFDHFRARQIGVNIDRKIRNRPSLCVCIRGWEKSSKHTVEWTFFFTFLLSAHQYIGRWCYFDDTNARVCVRVPVQSVWMHR